jgi:hypothetical protein
LCAFAVLPAGTATHPAAGVGNADVKVLGTSNLHDWSMEDKDVACSVQFVYASGKTLPVSLTAFTFALPVHSLKSGKSGMDSKAYPVQQCLSGQTLSFAVISEFGKYLFMRHCPCDAGDRNGEDEKPVDWMANSHGCCIHIFHGGVRVGKFSMRCSHTRDPGRGVDTA